jgi:hypothetical protein
MPKGETILKITNFRFKDIKSYKDLIPLCEKMDSEKKKIIVDFFDKLKPEAYTFSNIYDYFLNKEVNFPIMGYEVADYEIDSRVIYFFKNYDLKLNDDFIEYVLNKK